MILAERRFTIVASPERIWHLIGMVIFDSLPGLERIDLIDESNFRALLRMKLGFILLNMHLAGKMVDMSSPQFLGIMLKAKSKGGIFQLNQKVTFALTSVDKDRTEVVCKAIAKETGTLFRMLLLGRARSFARDTFDRIEERLRQLG